MFPTNNAQTTPRVVEALQKGLTGIIVLPQNPTADAIAAGTALYLSLLKLGKSVNLICSTEVKSDLAGADKFQSNLSVGGDNLVVSFPYTDGSIDKIDYNIQGQFFNLTVTPRPGFPKLNPNQVTFSYAGGSFDFIIAIDLPNLNTIGQVYTENQAQFQGKTIINIDRHLTNGFYGTVNFVNKTSSSTSELVFKIIQALQVEMDKDIATNLYAGVSTATNNFTAYSVNAETFEAVAQLLKAGAVKKAFNKPQQPPMSFGANNQGSQTFTMPPRPQTSAPVAAPGTQKTFESRSSGTIDTVEQGSAAQSKEGHPTPQDWLKPKIFKGGGLV